MKPLGMTYLLLELKTKLKHIIETGGLAFSITLQAFLRLVVMNINGMQNIQTH